MNKIEKKTYPVDKCLHHFIEEQVIKNPDKTALIYEGSALSYGELNIRANKLAHDLITQGVTPDTIVGVCAERSFEMVIALVGIVKAGGAYLPIDPHLPEQRIQYMIVESGAPIVTGQSRYSKKLGTSCSFLDLSGYLDADGEQWDNPDVDMTSENLAYLIYTSGSTGNPKGVMNQHDGIVNRLMWMQDQFQMTPEDNVIQKTPYSFDVSVWEFFWTLMMGATMVIARAEGHKDPEYLLSLIEKEKVTIIHFVPSMLRIFLQAQKIERSDSLRYVICSGEALDVPVHNKFFKLCKGELYNLYGPTEAAVDVTVWHCREDASICGVPIGFPITNIGISIHDGEGNEVRDGDEGELYISGIGVARGYINRPELTAEKFISRIDADGRFTRYYKTGDLARYRDDGAVDYLGRIDSQVKIRGFRVELGEIEACLEELDEVAQAVVLLREDTPGNQRLVGYIKLQKGKSFSLSENKDYLKSKLPEYMVPAYYVMMEDFPLSPNGKLARKLFPKPVHSRPDISTPYIKPKRSVEEKLVQLWQEQLDLEKIGIDDSFFEIGGTSLLAIELIMGINVEFGTDYQVLKIFQYPTVAQFADLVEGSSRNSRKRKSYLENSRESNDVEGIAIIGMSGRFPGADSVDELWENLVNGVESISRFTKDELGPGIDEELLDNPNYILARGIVEGADMFDASFFGVSPLEAKVMDPQQRIFLEEAWKALENSGYDAESFDGSIGAFAGIGDNHYYTKNLIGHKDLLDTVGSLTVEYGNQKDYIGTRACYALNLTGPGISVNTGCSTSLLAVDLAFRSLRDFECDIALAGGSDISVPQKRGFLYQLGGTFAKDGHCRPFDADATGTMFNDAVGVVVLKRLKDAIADNDTIYATLIGSAKNNDGSQKVSFLAPSVSGQSDVIERAHAMARVSAEDIGYIEAHGTATPIGDPIEIEALTKTFRQTTDKNQYCRIGSVKGNIGHPTIASGVTGLIKASLCLNKETIPGTLHYKAPNPQIDFPSSPFKVISQTEDWKRSDKERIAGISSFGFGGTNVHAILKEAPISEESGPSRPVQLYLLSAKSKVSLDGITSKMGDFLDRCDASAKADASYTLQTGRRNFSERRYLVLPDDLQASDVFSKLTPLTSGTRTCLSKDPEIIFMFPGQGSQYVNMGKQLYAHEQIFKQAVDQCCNILEPIMGRDLRTVIYPSVEDSKASYEALKDTYYTQPAIFVIEYALAMLLMSWGIKPTALVGHSVGEFVCACLSGIFTLNDALHLIAARGKLVKEMPHGCMLSVRESSEKLDKYLSDKIQMAAVNSPRLCVLSGPEDDIEELVKTLESDRISSRLLHTSHAFHSEMMQPVVPHFTEEVKKVTINNPQIPIISTVYGKEVSDELTDPSYWGNHVRNPVLFSHAVQHLSDRTDSVFLEIGPRNTLATLTRQHAFEGSSHGIISTLADNPENNTEYTAVLKAIGQLWTYGCAIDWESFYQNETRKKIPVPTYEFDRKSYWVEPIAMEAIGSSDCFNDVAEDESESTGDAGGADNSREVKKLRKILEETSGISLKAYNKDSTFIEMGMDSLLLTQIAFRISKEYKVKVTFGQLIQEFPNICLLLDYLSSSGDNGIGNIPQKQTADAIGERKKQGNYTIGTTEAQKVIWRDCRDRDLSCSYNDSIKLVFTGNFDKEKFAQSLNFVIDSHETLHAVFTEDGTALSVKSGFYPDYDYFDKTDQPIEEKENFIKDSLLHEQDTPFDLEKGPLIRVKLIRIDDERWEVFLTFHKSICDGWSVDIVLKELSDAYREDKAGQEITPSFDFNEYLDYESERNQGQDHKNLLEYWRNRLNIIVGDKNEPHLQRGTYRTSFEEVILSKEIYSKLQEISQNANYSIFILMITTLYFILKEALEKDRIIIGIPVAGQLQTNEHNLIGNCSNIILLNIESRQGENYPDVLKKVQNQFLDSYDNIYDIENLRRDLKGNLPDVDVIINNSAAFEKGELSFGDVSFDYTFNPRLYEKQQYYMDVREDNGTLKVLCHFDYSKDEGLVIYNTLSNSDEYIMKLLDNPLELMKNKDDLLSQPNYVNKHVIGLNKSTSEKLIYFVVGVQIYHELAGKLSDVAKCYGTYLPDEEALLVGDQSQENWDVSVLASGYKNIISRHSKGKPVSIIGVSFGGVVAYELAKQLKESGQDVELLVMLDTLLPTGIRKEKLKWFYLKVKESFNNGFRVTFRKISSKMRKGVTTKAVVRNEIVQQRNLVYGDAVSLFEKGSSKNYNGDTLLVRAIEEVNRPGYKLEESYGWDKYLNGCLHVEDSPGGHLDILKFPNVDVTAKKIKKILDKQ